MPSCGSNIPINDFTLLSYTQSSRNIISRSNMLNVGRFRSKDVCKSFCSNNTMTTWYKNSVSNQYLAPIPYAQRLGNLMRMSQQRGTKQYRIPVCINKQYGRYCGTGGTPLTNKF